MSSPPDAAATRRRMRRFWDRRAAENPWYFVDNRVDYAAPDRDRFWRTGAHDLETLLGTLEVTVGRSDRVVEIGCGVGRLTRPLAEAAADVVAIDVSPRMLALAEDHNPHADNVTWTLGDGSSLAPVPDASRDLCVSHVVFQHIPDPEIVYGYVREIARVLRPGGRAVFQVSTDPEVHAAGGSVWQRLRALLGGGPRGQADPCWTGAAVDLARLREVAAAVGMPVTRVEGAGTQFCLVRADRAAS